MLGNLEEPTANGRGYTSRHDDRYSGHAVLQGVPPHPDSVRTRRVTEGVYIEGNRFRSDDDRKEPGRAHKVLDLPWTGLATFRTRDVVWSEHSCYVFHFFFSVIISFSSASQPSVLLSSAVGFPYFSRSLSLPLPLPFGASRMADLAPGARILALYFSEAGELWHDRIIVILAQAPRRRCLDNAAFVRPQLRTIFKRIPTAFVACASFVDCINFACFTNFFVVY